MSIEYHAGPIQGEHYKTGPPSSPLGLPFLLTKDPEGHRLLMDVERGAIAKRETV
jgi:hypothetical protein